MDEFAFKQQVGVKIKQLRAIKGWTRQQMADKLEMSLAGYGGIERGETDISITRLAQIADTFEITLTDLLGWNENQVFNFTKTEKCNNWLVGSTASTETITLKNELEKCQLINLAQATEIENLKKQISQLEEINRLLSQK
jgi:transcriptional regulator with XRE-family HTH domain